MALVTSETAKTAARRFTLGFASGGVLPDAATPAAVTKPFAGAPYRSTEITNLGDAVKVYLKVPSAQVMLAVLMLGLIVRITLAVMGFGWWAFGWHDLAAVTFVVASTGTFEWFVHKYVLHAPIDSYRNRVLKTGASHRRHHEDPTILDNVVLGPECAAQYQAQLLMFAALWATPMALLAGWPVFATVGTGALASWLTLAHYEWVHLAVHTRHRFKNRFYARLQRNHRWHHFRNENYWLGVTSNSGDRLLGTLPKSKSDVSLSETARSLH